MTHPIATVRSPVPLGIMMNVRAIITVTAMLATIVFQGLLGADSLPLAPPPRPVPIAQLVERLGSEDFREREEATRRLLALDVDKPPPELLEAAKSDNPEVR